MNYRKSKYVVLILGILVFIIGLFYFTFIRNKANGLDASIRSKIIEAQRSGIQHTNISNMISRYCGNDYGKFSVILKENGFVESIKSRNRSDLLEKYEANQYSFFAKNFHMKMYSYWEVWVEAYSTNSKSCNVVSYLTYRAL